MDIFIETSSMYLLIFGTEILTLPLGPLKNILSQKIWNYFCTWHILKILTLHKNCCKLVNPFSGDKIWAEYKDRVIKIANTSPLVCTNESPMYVSPGGAILVNNNIYIYNTMEKNKKSKYSSSCNYVVNSTCWLSSVGFRQF